MSRTQKQFLSWFAFVLLTVILNTLLHTKLLKQPYLNNLSSVLLGIMIMGWGRMVRSRILYAQPRHCLTAVSWMLFSLYVLRVCRWEFFPHSPETSRFFWYLYYIPFIGVPLLSYHAALRLRDRKEPAQELGLKIFWATGAALAAGVLTNGLHGQLLRFPEPDSAAPDFAEHGWLYYVIIIWSALLSVGVLFVLIRRCRLSQCRKQLYIPVGMSAAGLAMMFWYNALGNSPELFGIKLFHIQDCYSLIFIGMWEGCIIIGLLPSNTGYQQLFSKSHINAVLKDQSNSVWYSSVYVQTGEDSSAEDLITQTKPLTGGSITWSEDVHTIRKLREKLAEANESLAEENDLIEEENRIAAERTQYETKNRLYDRIAAHTRRQLAEIAESFADTEHFSAGIQKNLLLGTYVKRCANLMLLADANQYLPTEELTLSLRETLDNLRFSGIDCVLQAGGTRQYPAGMLVTAYDLAEAAAEAVRGRGSVFCASVAPDADTVLLLETDAVLSPEALRPALQNSGLTLSVTEADGTCRLRIGGVQPNA